MNDQAMKFRLGVFALGAAILLAVLIILFGRFPVLFSRPLEYVVTFSEAPGVEPGTAVRKSGVRIGEVQSVDLDPDTGAVTVRIVVDRKYQLRKGDKATIGKNLILNDATINFSTQELRRSLPGAERIRFPRRNPGRHSPVFERSQESRLANPTGIRRGAFDVEGHPRGHPQLSGDEQGISRGCLKRQSFYGKCRQLPAYEPGPNDRCR